MFNDPARLIDCPECDGTFFPEDAVCSFCGYKNPLTKDEYDIDTPCGADLHE